MRFIDVVFTGLWFCNLRQTAIWRKSSDQPSGLQQDLRYCCRRRTAMSGKSSYEYVGLPFLIVGLARTNQDSCQTCEVEAPTNRPQTKSTVCTCGTNGRIDCQAVLGNRMGGGSMIVIMQHHIAIRTIVLVPNDYLPSGVKSGVCLHTRRVLRVRVI
jgi:hypothetical protein